MYFLASIHDCGFELASPDLAPQTFTSSQPKHEMGPSENRLASDVISAVEDFLNKIPQASLEWDYVGK